MTKLGGEYANVLMQQIKNPFWHGVFKHYRKLSAGSFPQNTVEYLGEYIHYNSNIIRDRRTVYVKEWVESGIFLVKGLLDQDGNFFSYDELKRFYGLARTNFLMYEGIVQARHEYMNKFSVELYACDNEFQSRTWACIHGGNKVLLSVLKSSKVLPTAVSKWNNVYPDLNWIFFIFKCTFTTKRHTFALVSNQAFASHFANTEVPIFV